MELLTKRLLLRPITAADIDDMFEYASNPNVGPRAGWKPHETKEDTGSVLREIFLEKDTIWGIICNHSQKLIGTIGLSEDRKRQGGKTAMLGYAIGEPYWSKGYTTEAAAAVLEYGFEALELELISAYCYPTNPASRRVMEKCGLRYEGTLRRAEELFNGDIQDHHCFSITKEEWESLLQNR